MMTKRLRGAHRRPPRLRKILLSITVAVVVLAVAVGLGAVRGLTMRPGAVMPTAVSASPYTAPRDVIVHTSTSPHKTPEVRATLRVVTPTPTPTPVVTGNPGLSGTLSCSGLEQLWVAAGGNPSKAFLAAEVAKAESGGRQYAHSPTDDIGYWQINVPAHPSLATYNPLGNAKAAVIISSNGTNWYPWTTYKQGAEIGQC